MVNALAALHHHHFFQIAQAEIVSQLPSHAQQDHGLIEIAAFEHGALGANGRKPMPKTRCHSVCDRTR
jgi:hypothetical protein